MVSGERGANYAAARGREVPGSGPARRGAAHLGGGRQQPRVVLHHALEPRGRLEGRARLVRVLWVDELAHRAARGLEALHIRREAHDDAVGVARVGRVAARPVDVGAAARVGEHRLQLVVLDRDERSRLRQRGVVGVGRRAHDQPPEHRGEGGDGLRRGGLHARQHAERHLGAARHRDELQVEAARRGDAERGEVRREVQRRRVLEEEEPPPPLARPPCRDARRVQQRVDIAVAVRLGLHAVRPVGREGGLRVRERRHLVLPQQRHLRRREAVVAVLPQQGADLLVRVVRGHDQQRQPHVAPEPRGEQRLQRGDVRGVHLQHARARRDLRRQRELDAAVAEPLAQPARRHRKGQVHGRLEPERLVPLELGIARRELHARVGRRHRRHPALKRVGAGAGLGEQAARILDVALDPARVGLVHRLNLRKKPVLLLVRRARRLPLGEEVALPKLEEQLRERDLGGAEHAGVGQQRLGPLARLVRRRGRARRRRGRRCHRHRAARGAGLWALVGARRRGFVSRGY